MTKILVADDIEDVRDMIGLMIHSSFDVEIIEALNGKHAIDLLEENPDIELIICDYEMPIQNGGQLYKYLSDKSSQIPFVLLSSLDLSYDDNLLNFSKQENTQILSKPFSLEQITKLVINFIGTSNMISKDQDVHEYFRISLEKLLLYTSLPSDLYIKIRDDKFLKITDKEESLSHQQIERFKEKDTKYLFFDLGQFNDFLNNSLAHLQKQLSNTNLNQQELVSLQLTSIKQVQEVVKKIGIKAPVIRLTDQVAESITSSLKEDHSLKKILKDIVNKKDFVFELSSILNYIASATIKELGWDQMRATKKIISASMFIDIAFNDIKLAMIQDLTTQNFLDLKKEEKEMIKNHMYLAQDLMNKSAAAFADELKLIENHHEKPDGSGFPKGLTSDQISPFAALFILAHNYSYQLIINGGPEKISAEKILNILGDAYSQNNFSKPYLALKKVVLKQS